MTYRQLIQKLQNTPSIDLDEDVTLIFDDEAYPAELRQIDPDEHLSSVLDAGHTVLDIRIFTEAERTASILEGL